MTEQVQEKSQPTIETIEVGAVVKQVDGTTYAQDRFSGKRLVVVAVDRADKTLPIKVRAEMDEDGVADWIGEWTLADKEPVAEAAPEEAAKPKFAIGNVVSTETMGGSFVIATVVGLLPDPERVAVVGKRLIDTAPQFRLLPVEHVSPLADLPCPPLTLEEIGTTLTARIVEADAARDRAQQNALETSRAHEAFREQVRDKAIEVQEAQGWCVPGLNEVLEDLGLERKTTEYEVEVVLTARQTVRITVEATNEEEAAEKATDDMTDEIANAIDDGDWDWEIDETGDVSEA